MLLGLIPTIVGIIVSVIPNIIRIWERKQRYSHEITLAKLQIEAAREKLDFNAIIESIKSVVQEGESLRHHDSAISSVQWINSLRATVRPVLTYSFFGLFCVIKIMVALLMYREGYNGLEVFAVVWDQYTVSIFGAIVGFWFGTRSMVYINETFFNTKPIKKKKK